MRLPGLLAHKIPIRCPACDEPLRRWDILRLSKKVAAPCPWCATSIGFPLYDRRHWKTQLVIIAALPLLLIGIIPPLAVGQALLEMLLQGQVIKKPEFVWEALAAWLAVGPISAYSFYAVLWSWLTRHSTLKVFQVPIPSRKIELKAWLIYAPAVMAPILSLLAVLDSRAELLGTVWVLMFSVKWILPTCLAFAFLIQRAFPAAFSWATQRVGTGLSPKHWLWGLLFGTGLAFAGPGAMMLINSSLPTEASTVTYPWLDGKIEKIKINPLSRKSCKVSIRSRLEPEAIEIHAHAKVCERFSTGQTVVTVYRRGRLGVYFVPAEYAAVFSKPLTLDTGVRTADGRPVLSSDGGVYVGH